MSAYVLRPAQGLEIKLCRVLLGSEGSTHPHYHLFLAADEERRPLGVGSVRSGAESLGESWGLHLATLPGVSCDAVVGALLEYAKRFAAEQGATALQTLRWIERDSPEEMFWRSLGFEQDQSRYAHEIAVDHCRSRLQPLIEQVHDHGWIPKDARIVPLAEADIERVCDLHLRYLGGDAGTLVPMLDGSAPHPYDRQASVVLMCGERTQGFTLGWFPDPSRCEIAANVLDPSVRVGWADLMLKYAACERVRQRKAERFRFCTGEQHTDSRRTLGWLGAGVTRAEVRLKAKISVAEAASLASIV
jgi:hypothetical protein